MVVVEVSLFSHWSSDHIIEDGAYDFEEMIKNF